MMRRHFSRLVPGGLHRFAAATFLSTATAFAFPAGAVDLGDLNIPPDRLTHPDGSSRWYPPPPIPDTSGWTRVDVGDFMAGCSTADNSVDDESCVDAAVAAAANVPGPVELFFPGNATYNFQGNQTIEINRSNIVLRCENPATTVLKWHADTEGEQCGNNDAGYYASALGGFCGDQRYSNQVSWTGGFGSDDTTLTVSSVSGYQIGDWVVAWAETPSACYDGSSFDNRALLHMARVASVNTASSQITIDRPLRMEYDAACSPRYVAKPRQILENVGIENCTLRHADHDNSAPSFQALWLFYATSNGWAHGNNFRDHYNRGVTVGLSRDTVVDRNNFSNIGYVNSNTGTAHVQWGATDTYILNNVFIGTRTAAYLENGPQGTIIAYNYTDGNQDCERSHFLHGRYTREVLVEGNDGDCAIQVDSRWGRQGPRNTIYRNRHRQPDESRNFPRSIWSPSTHKDGQGPFIADRLNIVANSGSWFMQGPNFPTTPDSFAVHQIDGYTTNMWLELNVATMSIALQSPQATTRCGTGSAADCVVNGNYLGRNYFGGSSAPSPAWDSVRIPDSLFLEEAPAWWCQEACDFGASDGIGALGDDFNGALCKLPAQIWYEGGTCTPLDPNAPPPPPIPAPPVLLQP